jgi:osmotically-inducible protein OsmY
MEEKIDSSMIGPAEASLFRSSDQIKKEIIELIQANDAIYPKDIEVEVHDGTVILRGRVKDQIAVEEAVQIAREALGVTSVQNELEVGG